MTKDFKGPENEAKRRARKALSELVSMPAYGGIAISIDVNDVTSESCVVGPQDLVIRALESLLLKMYKTSGEAPSADFSEAVLLVAWEAFVKSEKADPTSGPGGNA